MKFLSIMILIGLFVLAVTGCSTTNGYPSMGPAFAPAYGAKSPAYWYGYTQGKSYTSPVVTSPSKGK